MKKVFIIPFFVLIITSCRKDRTCECTSTYTTSSLVGTSVEVVEHNHKYQDLNKREAKDACSDYSNSETYSYATGNYTQLETRSCELK